MGDQSFIPKKQPAGRREQVDKLRATVAKLTEENALLRAAQPSAELNVRLKYLENQNRLLREQLRVRAGI